MNKKIGRAVSNVLIVGGLTVTAGSIYDMTQNKELNEEVALRAQITRDLRAQYNVDTECGLDPFASGPTVCVEFEVVKGVDKGEEEERDLGEYREELKKRLAEAPRDPEANARGVHAGLAAVGGAVVGALGVTIRPSKERGG